jgi:hypothetical protein
MATDLDVRVKEPFTVEALRTAGGGVLERIVPGAQPSALDVRVWKPEFRGRYAESPVRRRSCCKACTASARRPFPATSS